MKKKLLKSTLCLSLAAILSIMTACGSNASSVTSTESNSQESSAEETTSETDSSSESTASGDASVKPGNYSKETALADRTTDTFNETAFDACTAKMGELSQSEGHADEINALYDEILEWLNCIVSDQAIANFRYSADVTDVEAATLVSTIQMTSAQKQNEALLLFQEILKSDLYCDSFTEHIGTDVAKAVKEYKQSDEDLMNLVYQNSELTQKYNTLMTEDYKEENVQKQIKEVYLEIVKNNNKVAAWYGYDNYIDFSLYLYGRDYTAEQADSIKDAIKENVLPLYYAYNNWVAESGCINGVNEDYTVTEDDLKKIPDLLKNIDSSLSDNFNHLLDQKLYDNEKSDTKTGAQFTSPLPSYKDACMLLSPNGIVRDFTTVIHEFGHFNNFCSADYNALNTGTVVDVYEISSQALEMLFAKYYPDLNSTYGEALKEQTCYGMLYNIMSAFMVYDAECQIYRTEDLTVEKLDQIWSDTIQKYGMEQDYPENSWIAITHLFTQPCYYIGYGTSGLIALELYNMSCSDYDKAIDCYRQIYSAQPGIQFNELVQKAGLTDIFSADTIENICSEYAKNLGVADEYAEMKENMTSADAA